MSSLSDVGISPVLLQAVSQSLKTSHHPPSTTAQSTMEMQQPGSNGNSSVRDLVSDILQQKHGQTETSVDSDTIKTMLKIKMAANAMSKSVMSEDGSGKESADAGSELAMANVLTALASQSTSEGTSNVRTVETSEGVGTLSQGDSGALSKSRLMFGPKTIVTSVNIGGQNVLVQTAPPREQAESNTDPKALYTLIKPDNVRSVVHQEKADRSEDGGASVNPHQLIVSSRQDGAGNQILLDAKTVTLSSRTTTSPVVICYETDTGSQSVQSIADCSQQIIEHNGKRYIIHTPNLESSGEPATCTKYIAVQSSEVEPTQHTFIQMEEGGTYSEVANQEVVGQQEGEVTLSVSGSVPVYSDSVQTFTDPGMSSVSGMSCPICGDHVSGFHYGIFTCESCKGFFKRTVQNKKTFLCHRQGECEIKLENRKKCPACRFAKCLVMGMKLEAIRQDRSRGGRSSYSGVSPLGEPKAKRPVRPIQRRLSVPLLSDSRLVSALSYGDETSKQATPKPYVPQILTDIMNLESLLCDDDIPSTISGEDFSVTDPNVFLTLLQLCELKLYKIVRWARNLPYFATISTDDQILLLQNCWCELLALTMCWKSIHLTSEIIFFHGQAIDREKANLLDVGDLFTKLLMVVEHFKRLKLDQYECVALKVIILICPDIKGLTDAQRLGEQQAKISSALETYTTSHYRQSPTKYGEVLLRLAELSRISCMLKDHLMNWMPPNTNSCGLLYELLKGENMKDLV